MESNGMIHPEIIEVMSHYTLQVHYAETFGRLHKVYTDQGVYALKSIKPEQKMDFVKNVQRLYQRGYNRIVPIYVTVDGRYGVLHHNRLYYLMPWLADEDIGERNEKHKQMFRELARIHALTVKEKEIEPDERDLHYEKMLDSWKRQEEFLKEFMELTERKWYMSPFELMFCSYYYDISQALSFSIKKLEEWYEKTKDDDKVRTVLTHGKLSVQHFLLDERAFGYFINFENAKVAPQHFDLLPFFVKYCDTYPIRCDDCVEWLYHYYKFFPMRDEEIMLFTCYLAYPTHIIQTVEDYHEKKYRLKNEYSSVAQLQKNFWQLKNIEYFVMKIEETEAQKKAAQEQAQTEN
ncbi:MAG: spore coat protein YsxE [Bacillus sp. (in: firmicutes)]